MSYSSSFCQAYLDLIKSHYSSLNLTRILEENEFYEKQYLDSLLPFDKSSKLNEIIEEVDFVLDMGFGGGFPVLPLADRYNETYFLGIDSKAKKVQAVQEIADSIGLENVKLIHGRFESFNLDLPLLITFKAVGKMRDLILSLNPSEEIYILFYKGPNVETQEKIPKKLKGWELVDSFQCDLVNKYSRKFFLYHFVPRGTVKKKKNLVNLTDLI